jgi:hypothetical protein
VNSPNLNTDTLGKERLDKFIRVSVCVDWRVDVAMNEGKSASAREPGHYR